MMAVRCMWIDWSGGPGLAGEPGLNLVAGDLNGSEAARGHGEGTRRHNPRGEGGLDAHPSLLVVADGLLGIDSSSRLDSASKPPSQHPLEFSAPCCAR
jgi:hypothetical protein